MRPAGLGACRPGDQDRQLAVWFSSLGSRVGTEWRACPRVATRPLRASPITLGFLGRCPFRHALMVVLWTTGAYPQAQ